MTSAKDGTFRAKGIAPGATGGLFFVPERGEFVKFLDPQKRWQLQQPNVLTFQNLPAATYNDIEVRVSKMVHAKGVIRDQAGKPADKAEVEVVQTHRIYFANAKGEYDAEIPPGEAVDLKIFGHNGYESSQEVVTVKGEAGKGVVQDLIAKRHGAEVATGCVRGQVVDEAGNPVGRAWVMRGNEALLSRDAMDAAGGSRSDLKMPTWMGGRFSPAVVVSGDQGQFKFDMLHEGISDVWAIDDRHGRARVGSGCEHWVERCEDRFAGARINAEDHRARGRRAGQGGEGEGGAVCDE